jgi:ribbon-helix-helix CopG family protein
MVKTTVYLPEEVKAALDREALRTSTSEAELIRTAITRLLGLTARPRPHFGELSGPSLTVEEMDDTLASGFGER